MKYIALFICFILSSITYAQLEISLKDSSSIDCNTVIESLSKTEYFEKARQVSPEKAISKCIISLHSSSGCLVSRESSLEIFSDGNTGYILQSTDNKNESYFKLVNDSILVNMLNKMNESFAFDNTILISVPVAHPNTGMGSSSLKIDILFADGEKIQNNIDFSGFRIYCVYEPILMEYLLSLKKNTFIPLSVKEANHILDYYKSSIIASMFITNFNNFKYNFIKPLVPRNFQQTLSKPIDNYRITK